MTGILNIQVKPIIGNKELNLKKIEHYIKKYSDKNLDLVVFPEFFSTGISHEQFLNYPEDENGGDTIAFIQELAKKYNTNIIAGTVIEKSADKLYNTSFIIDRNGNIIDKYRKIHLFNYMGGTEGERITPGDREVVVDFDFGKVGLGICFDIRYPLHYNKLIKKGADIIVLPTKTIPQGIVAMVNYIPDYSAEENKETMLSEIGNVKTGQVTYAVRDTEIDGKTIKQNDYMGIGDSSILSVGQDLKATTLEMVDAMVDEDSAIVSIYYGTDATEEAAEEIGTVIEEKYPDVEVEINAGGQPISYYVISVE